jgi:phage shock protein A
MKGTGDDIPTTFNADTHPAILLARIAELEEWQRKRTRITGQVIDETEQLETRIRELEAALAEARQLLGVYRVQRDRAEAALRTAGADSAGPGR